MNLKILLAAAVLMAPSYAIAAGSDSSDEPSEVQCKEGKVWDKKDKKCVVAESSLINDDDRYEAVRQLAYAGQYDNAKRVLAAMTDQDDTRVLTYRGFIARKTGKMDQAMAYYQDAISADPNNTLVRSYMGQGLVESGDLKAAREQLAEIRSRGGRGTWPEVALARAIKTGQGYSY